MVVGKRSHANAMLEAYWSSGEKLQNFQRCLTCHSADAPGLMKEKGELGYYKGDFVAPDVGVNPVGCANCHDTSTFKLNVANPHAIRSIEAMGKDPQKLSTQELKSYVCMQCHFEYDKVKKGDVIVLESNWDRYGNLENLARFYDEEMASNFTHPLSKVPLVKPMNNEAGLATNGTHAKHGVACADCHMPKTTAKNGTRYTNHDNVAASWKIEDNCQSCHTKVSAKQLKKDIDSRMSEYNGQNVKALGRQIADTHLLIKKGLDAGIEQKQFEKVYAPLRKAQWRWDYLLWQKGGAFHAGFETQKLLAKALVEAAQARATTSEILLKNGVKDLSVPSYKSVEDAAKILGVDPKSAKGTPTDYSYVIGHLEHAKKAGTIDPKVLANEVKIMDIKVK